MAQVKFSISDDLDHTGKLGKDLGQAIFQPDNKDIKLFLLGSAAIFTSMLLIDNPIKDYANDHQNPFKDNLFSIDKYYGDVKYMIGGSLALYGSGYLFKDKHLKNMGLRAGQAYFYNGLITVIIKEIMGRARPFANEGPFSYHPFAFQEQYRSFFSGHTSGVFAVSTVMAHEFDYWWWKTIWYGAAFLVGGARIYHNQHWFSDVLAGALVGYAVGRFTATYDYPKDESSSIEMSMGTQQREMILNFTFLLN